tara:strand:+ start:342 stop:1493 length:1152 start_codon:yes stop_codon:yes gene_type:complete
MKLSLTFILTLLIVFVTSCSTIPSEFDRNDELIQKDNSLFMNRHFKNPVNADVINALSKGYNLKKLNDDEKELIISSIRNGNIKRAYINKIDIMLKDLDKVFSSELELNISTSEKNKKIILESLLNDEMIFSISFNENTVNSINNDVLNAKLSFFCESFVSEQRNIIEKHIFKNETSNNKILVISSEKFSNTVGKLKDNYPDQIYLELNNQNFETGIQEVLEINESNQRKLMVSKLDSSIQIEHNPRIRKDIDRVYFLVSYDLGKAVAPLLRNYSVDLAIFSSSEIFHGASNLNDLADFENILIPISRNFLISANQKNLNNLKDKFENLLLEDYLTLEKITQNNLYDTSYLLNTGEVSVNEGQCINRKMNFWNIDISQIITQP